MTSEYCPQKQVLVTIQENGIIRGPSGRYLARLDSDIPYHSEHLDPIVVEYKDQYESLLKQVADYIEGEDWSSDEQYTDLHAKTVVDMILRHTWDSINNPDDEKEDIRKYKI